MVNEEKVRLMTRLAMYEQSTGKEDLEKGRYFKSDYVKYNCLKTLVSTTILFVIVVAAYLLQYGQTDHGACRYRSVRSGI